MKLRSKMMNVWTALLLLLPIVNVNGSSLLQYQSNSAFCQGNVTDLVFVSATCPDEPYGCTWGSTVSLYVRFNATTDIPHRTTVTVSPSLPHFPRSGIHTIYNHTEYISQSCGTVLAPPAGGDAGYSCPDAGVYNFRPNVVLFGNTSSWYGRYHGFSIGLSVHIYDASTGDEYASCYAEMKVKQGQENPATDWAFLGGGLASLALAGYMYRKRRISTHREQQSHESEETTTHFELISDPICRV